MRARLFLALWIPALLASATALPLVFEMLEVTGTTTENNPPPIPLPLIIAGAALQNSLLLALIVWVGFRFAPKVGLSIPYIQQWVEGKQPGSLKPLRTLGRAFFSGLLCGLMVVLVDLLVFRSLVSSKLLEPLLRIPLWKRLLAGLFYGGITEEIVMRWCLMSVIAWLLSRYLWRNPASDGPFRAAILLVALLFGLGHLPATAAITPLTGAVVARALLLNGIVAVACGYLFWRRGLECAMVAHAAAHLPLQIIEPFLLKILAPTTC